LFEEALQAVARFFGGEFSGVPAGVAESKGEVKREGTDDKGGDQEHVQSRASEAHRILVAKSETRPAAVGVSARIK
jgi:hypothetical protein